MALLFTETASAREFLCHRLIRALSLTMTGDCQFKAQSRVDEKQLGLEGGRNSHRVNKGASGSREI
jgi:hypothetical protein